MKQTAEIWADRGKYLATFQKLLNYDANTAAMSSLSLENPTESTESFMVCCPLRTKGDF